MPAFSSRLKNRVTAFALIALHVINVAALTRFPFMYTGKGILDSYVIIFSQMAGGLDFCIFFVLWLVTTVLCIFLLKMHVFRESLLKLALIVLIMAFGPAGRCLPAAMLSGDPEYLLLMPWLYWDLFSAALGFNQF